MPDLQLRADGLDRRLVPPGVHDGRSRAIIALAARAADALDPHKLLLTDIDKVDARLLPALVRARSVEEFVMDGMPETMIRQIVKSAPILHARKGTVAGIRQALALLDMEAEWKPWHALVPPGPPNTYSATVFVGSIVFQEESILSARHLQAGQRMIDGMKRHSQEGTVRFARLMRDERRLGLFARLKERVTTTPLRATDRAVRVATRFGVAAYSFHRLTTLPHASLARSA